VVSRDYAKSDTLERDGKQSKSVSALPHSEVDCIDDSSGITSAIADPQRASAR